MSNDTPHSVVSALDQLEEKQQLFVHEYIKDLNGTKAAIRAHYSEDTARQQASRLLSNVNIQNAIAELKAQRNERLNIDADTVLWKWWQIANADYNELSSVKRVACGYCYGGVNITDDSEPSIDPTKAPDEDCSTCGGDGEAYVYMADTTNLSPDARLLYQGAENTKFGIKINTADRMKALDNVARHLGMFKDVIDHQSSDGSMTPQAAPDYSRLSDDELRQYAELESKAARDKS